MNRPQSQYKETQILTASPEKLLLMLYDAAIVCLETAIDYLKKEKPVKNYDKINTQLLKAQEIVGELMATLDLEKGGEIAINLQSLYAYFLQQIMQGNLHKTKEPVEEVLNHMVELRDTWKEVIKQKSNTSNVYPKAKNLSGGNSNSSGFNISG